MSVGPQISWTGFVVMAFAFVVIAILHKADPPVQVKAALVFAFAIGAVAIPVGMIVGIWS